MLVKKAFEIHFFIKELKIKWAIQDTVVKEIKFLPLELPEENLD